MHDCQPHSHTNKRKAPHVAACRFGSSFVGAIALCVLLCGCGPDKQSTRIPPANRKSSETQVDTEPAGKVEESSTTASAGGPQEAKPNDSVSGNSANPDTADAEVSTTVKQQATSDNEPHESAEEQLATAGSGQHSSDPASASQADMLAKASGEQTATEDDQLKPVPAERIMLLTDAGPLIADLHITIDGTPYAESFQSVVADVMKIADDDGDGIVDWDQIMAHPRFRQGQFGNPASTTYQASQDMIRQYDTTKNGRVDPDELVRYLGGGQVTSQPLTLYTSNYRRTLNRDASPIRRWLDQNDDLTLDKFEIESATQRLRLRDGNDDEVLLASDFAESNSGQDTMMMRRRPSDTQYLPKVGWHLESNQQWSDIRVAWNDFFALGQVVQAGDLGITSSVFEKLDLDGDGDLDNIEMEMLAEIEPDFAVNVELSRGEGQDSATIEFGALRLPSDHIESIIQQPNRITLRLEKATIDLFAKDLIGYAAYDQQAMGFIRQGDADENGYLDEEEFGRVAQFFNGIEIDAADLNDDNQVTQDELVTLLEQRNIMSRNQVSVRADDQDDALFPTIDLNSDGRIDSREMAEASQTLLTLDRNGDGDVALHELRGSMLIGVVRGGNRGTIMQGDTTFQVPQAVSKPSESTPKWFVAMDRNRDQGISWREFLGTRVQFNELDVDQDGFLSPAEATSE